MKESQVYQKTFKYIDPKSDEPYLLIECDRKAHSVNLQKAIYFGDLPVTVAPHRSLNTSKGVVRHNSLKYVDPIEIIDGLRPEGVIDAKKIQITKDGSKINTNTVILTFGMPVIPTKINVGLYRVDVQPYIPNPLRCFKCQKFGHHSAKCRNETVVCARCGEEGHDDKTCKTEEIHSVNCKGDHCSFSRDCPHWRRRFNLLHISKMCLLGRQDRL